MKSNYFSNLSGRISLALILLCPVTALADGKKAVKDVKFTNGVVVFAGSDSAHVVSVVDEPSPLKRQQQVSYNVYDSKDTVTADVSKVRLYAIRKKKYISIPIQTDNGVKNVFVEYQAKDTLNTPILYKVYTTDKKYEIYMAEKKGLIAKKITQDGKLTDNRLQDFLLRKNEAAGGNEEIADYIKTVYPDKWSVELRNDVIASQNPNKIARYRFGVGVGANINSCNINSCFNTFYRNSIISGGTSTNLAATLFADIRSFMGLGLHPEVTFYKVACSTGGDYSGELYQMVYNRTAIAVPLMVRYTFTGMRGKWLPYVQAGVQFNFNIKDECTDLRILSSDSDDYSYSKYSDKGIATSLVGGVGVEYRLTTRHSLFLDLKYAYQVGDNEVQDKYTLKVNSLMLNLSFNL